MAQAPEPTQPARSPAAQRLSNTIDELAMLRGVDEPPEPDQ